MANKSIYKIRIKDGIDNRVWYCGLGGRIFYTVKTIVEKNIYWEIVNNEELGGSLINTRDADTLELLTRVVLPFN